MGLNGDRGDRIGERHSSVSHHREEPYAVVRAPSLAAQEDGSPGRSKGKTKLADARKKKKQGARQRDAASRDNGPTINQRRANVRRKRFGQQKLCEKHSPTNYGGGGGPRNYQAPRRAVKRGVPLHRGTISGEQGGEEATRRGGGYWRLRGAGAVRHRRRASVASRRDEVRPQPRRGATPNCSRPAPAARRAPNNNDAASEAAALRSQDKQCGPDAIAMVTRPETTVPPARKKEKALSVGSLPENRYRSLG
ncbi:hypothetical protein MTO96_002766 [Rhipicephalus appendiculatus]